MRSSWDFWGQCETNSNTLREKEVSIVNFGNHFQGSQFFTKLSYLTLTTSRMWAYFLGLCQVSGLGREEGLGNWIIKPQPVTADWVETPWSRLVADGATFITTWCSATPIAHSGRKWRESWHMTHIFSAAQETGETSSQRVSEVILSGAGGDAKATVVGKEMDLLQLEEMLHRRKISPCC